MITDIGLPGLNGRQVVDAARLSRPDLKVLFLTGYAENAAIAAGFLEPGMAMLTKPFSLDVLATRVQEMIEGGEPSIAPSGRFASEFERADPRKVHERAAPLTTPDLA